jgi:hypothetical protein
LNGKKGAQSAPIVIQAQGKAIPRDGVQKIAVWQGMIDIRGTEPYTQEIRLEDFRRVLRRKEAQ